MGIDISTYYANNGIGAASSSKSAYSLDMEDFLQLLVAQLKNQDVMSPMSDSEFMSQMTQMASVNAINAITDMVNMSYAASLVGKEVTVLDANAGALVEGKVTGTGIYDGEQIIFLDNDKSYTLSSIVTIGKLPSGDE